MLQGGVQEELATTADGVADKCSLCLRPGPRGALDARGVYVVWAVRTVAHRRARHCVFSSQHPAEHSAQEVFVTSGHLCCLTHFNNY